MDDVEALKALEEREKNLRQGIANITRDIEGAQAALVRGEPPERLVHFIQDRQADLHDHYLQLGRTEQRIEDSKARIEERDAQGDKQWFRRQVPEPQAVPRETVAQEKRDWFRREQGTDQNNPADPVHNRSGRDRS